jgi:hypothetical protein
MEIPPFKFLLARIVSSSRADVNVLKCKGSSSVRRLTQSIFNALPIAMNCKCVRPHNVGLELVPRNAILIPGDFDDQVAKNLNLHAIWGSDGDSMNQQTKRNAKTDLDSRGESLRIQLANFE